MSVERASSSDSPRPRRVLIVDDDADSRDLLGQLIDAMGHRTIQAATGGAAIECVENEALDLAVIDLDLPGIDGCEVARRIRQTHAGAKIRLVALTGYSDARTRQSAVEAGFDDFLTKPARARTIERTVNAGPRPPS